MATQTSVEMSELSMPLQRQIDITIEQMQNCTEKLDVVLCLPGWKPVIFIFLCLIVISNLVEEFDVTTAVIVTLIVVILYCFSALVRWCEQPSPAKAVGELDRLATELKYKVNTLKQTLEAVRNTEWLSSWKSRWKSLDELDVLAKDVMDLVSQLQSETHSKLISQLKEKLKKCQELVKKI
ncbi:hypothetical protein NL108_012944 [Boleophthalmus pectinirostris]|nr:hypothetical protein NL108_012944 [Boleophthalmus pectinirostris]